MKTSQELAMSIKETAKSKNITIGKMLSDCGLSVNTLSSMQSGGYFPRLEAINKIADYLNCSVDYLLGRTDTPNEYNNNQINNSNNIAFGKNSSVNVGSGEIEKEICNILNSLNLRERSELLTIIYQFCDKCKNKETL